MTATEAGTPFPKYVRYLIGLVCGLVALSAIGLAVASVAVSNQPVWLLMGFEIVVVIAGVLGVIFATGGSQQGQGLALACFSGTIAVASFLGWLAASRGQITTNATGAFVSITPLLMGRVLAAALLGLLGAYAVLRRRAAAAMPLLVRGVLFGLPLAAALAVVAVARKQVGAVVDKMPDWLATAGAALLGILAIVLISGCAHYIIRAFETGRTEEA